MNDLTASSAPALACPGCGGSVAMTDRFSKVAVCEWCGQTLAVHDARLDPTGKVATLADTPSILAVGATGALAGRRFRVLGRLRYDYGDGFWDEWYLKFADGKSGWLQEDEGEFALFEKRRLTDEVPPFEALRVGAKIPIGEWNVFVSEKGTATIAGGEGELAFAILPGESVNYVDGNAKGKIVALEYTESGIDLSVGGEVDFESVAVDGDK